MTVRLRLTVATLALLAPLAAASGQTVTSIRPDVGAASTGTHVSTSGSVTTIDGGTLRGANLFHSFQTFDLGNGDTARWTTTLANPATIGNVINRVTGGDLSHIEGTIDSTALPGAAFFFINPAGIVFGGGAHINVPGAAYFSTASALNFADGAIFSATTPGGSTLTTASPTAFGFLGGEGDVSVNGGTRIAKATGSLTLAGANVRLGSGTTVSADGVSLAAVGPQPIELSLAGAAPAAGLAGTIALTGATVSTQTSGASDSGAISLAGGDIAITAGAQVSTTTTGTGAAGAVSVRGDTVTIDASKVASASGVDLSKLSVIQSAFVVEFLGDPGVAIYGAICGCFLPGSGNAGQVSIAGTNAVSILDGATVGSASRGAGNNIAVDVEAPRVTISGLSQIGSSVVGTESLGSGNAGDVSVSGSDFVTLRFGAVAGLSFASGGGSPGLIDIAGGAISLYNSYVGSPRAGQAGFGATGSAIGITATGDLSIDHDSAIDSRSASLDAGTISISATNITVSDSQIASFNEGAGSGGRIEIRARGDATLTDADIESEVAGQETAAAGNIDITAGGELNYQQGVPADYGLDGFLITPSISSSAVDRGSAGIITLDAPSIVIGDGATISSTTERPSDVAGAASTGGSINILGDDIRIGRATVSAETFGAGDAGTIRVAGGDVAIAGGRLVTDSGTVGVDTGIGQSHLVAAGGNAGNIMLTGSRSLTVSDGANVSSDTIGAGTAGTIILSAPRLIVDASAISSDSSYYDAQPTTTVQTFPPGTAVEVTKTIGPTDLVVATGRAGDIELSSDTSLIVRNGASLSSSTFGPGAAGAISLNAPAIMLSDATIRSDSRLVTVASRTVTTRTDCTDFSCDESRLISSVTTTGAPITLSATGAAGNVGVTGQDVRIDGGSTISSNTQGTAAAGDVTVTAQTLTADQASQISSSSLGCADRSCAGGASGTVSVNAPNLTLDDGAQIATLSKSQTAAGRIVIGSTFLTLLRGSSITTNSAYGPAGDIGIQITDDVGLIKLDSAAAPSVITTSSGPGTGGRITIRGPIAIISNGGSILAQSEQGGANVAIDSEYFISSADRPNVISVNGALAIDSNIYDVTAGTGVPDVAYLDASKVLSGQCANARASGETSGFGAKVTGPYAPVPLRARAAVGKIAFVPLAASPCS